MGRRGDGAEVSAAGPFVGWGLVAWGLKIEDWTPPSFFGGVFSFGGLVSFTAEAVNAWRYDFFGKNGGVFSSSRHTGLGETRGSASLARKKQRGFFPFRAFIGKGKKRVAAHADAAAASLRCAGVPGGTTT